MTTQPTNKPPNHPPFSRYQPLPPNLTAHHLRLTLSVETPIELDQHPGASLRGMLYNALRGPRNNPAGGFCVQRHLNSCADCSLIAACPVAGLVATMNPQAERGRDVPRPYTIEPPPPGSSNYDPGDKLTFGLTLLGDALKLFPYVVMALRQAGPYGLGKKLPQETAGGQYRRGRFELRRVEAINLLTGEAQAVLEPGSTLVQQPSLPVTPAQVEAEARRMLSLPLPVAGNGQGGGSTFQRGQVEQPVELIVQFLTPTRLTHRKHLLKRPEFSPLFHRLLDRLTQLSREYVAAEGPAPTLDEPALLALADSVELVDNQTGWREVWSYSNRQGRRIPISGLMGTATYRANRECWAVLLPFLIWGSVVHVGKNAVKGEGLIRVSPVQEA
jgi:hypothetical protein